MPNLLGGPGFEAAAGDMDGDGIADPFVCNMETGQCITLFSSCQSMRFDTGAGFLGTPGWLLTLADYDGDGKGDPSIYNPNDGTITVKYSSMNFTPPITFSEYLNPFKY